MCEKTAANDNWQNYAGCVPDVLVKNLQIFEIKQLADKEALYKTQCRVAIRKFRDWKKEQADQTDMIEILYGTMEGDILRGIAQKQVHLYWLIRKHFRNAFAIYLKNTGVYKKSYPIAA